jgi:hypothetical protein
VVFAVPEMCTLPSAERPLRLAEFEELFRGSVRRAEVVSPVRARVWMSGPAGLGASVRDLAARESQCCSFFTFTVTPGGGGGAVGEELVLDVQVPAAHTEVLAAFAGWAGSVVARPS